LAAHLYEKKQEVKDFGLELNWPAVMQKTTLRSVEPEPLKFIDFFSSVSVHKKPCRGFDY